MTRVTTHLTWRFSSPLGFSWWAQPRPSVPRDSKRERRERPRHVLELCSRGESLSFPPVPDCLIASGRVFHLRARDERPGSQGYRRRGQEEGGGRTLQPVVNSGIEDPCLRQQSSPGCVGPPLPSLHSLP